jgi:hypothetical protein
LTAIKNLRGENDYYVDWCNPTERLQRSEEMMISSLSDYELSIGTRLSDNERAKRFVLKSIVIKFEFLLQCEGKFFKN